MRLFSLRIFFISLLPVRLNGTGPSDTRCFLAGTNGNDIGTPFMRDCTVPEETAIFFPLINAIFFNDPDLGESFTVAEKREGLG